MARLPKLLCPEAEYRQINEESRVFCRKRQDICLYQWWKPCKGWWQMHEDAELCKFRNGGKENARENAEA